MSRSTGTDDPDERPTVQSSDESQYRETIPVSSRITRLRSQQRNRGSSREIGVMKCDASGDSSRFIGSASGIHFIRKVTQALSRTGHQDRSISSAIEDLVPGEDDQFATETPQCVETPFSTLRNILWRDGEIDTSGSCSNVTFANLVAWTQSYFDNWHPLFPFLHGPNMLELLERIQEVGIARISDADAAIVKSLVSISLADSRQMSRYKGRRHAKFLFRHHEDASSAAILLMNAPASLKVLQAALCVQLFHVSMLRYNTASRLGGLAMRMAFHLGLHRCPSRYSHFSPEERIMRKRIWWSLYSLDRMICQCLGHPMGIADDDVDVCLPTDEIHRLPNVEDSNSRQGPDQLTLLTLLSHHARLRSTILGLRNRAISQRNDTMDRAMVVQSELSSWINLVQETLCDSPDNEGGNVRNPNRSTAVPLSQKTLLFILQHEAILALNRPLLSLEVTSPSCRAALQTCIGSSRAIIDIVESEGGLLQDASAEHSIMTWPLLTWSVWISCFILVYAALEEATTRRSALRYTKKAQVILQALSKRGTTWPDRCLQAVKHLVLALESPDSARDDERFGRHRRPSQTLGRQWRSGFADPSERMHSPLHRGVSQPQAATVQPTFNMFEVATGTPLSPRNERDLARNDADNENLLTQPRPGSDFDYTDPQFSLFLDTSIRDVDDQASSDPFGVMDFANFAQCGDVGWDLDEQMY